LCDWAAHQRPWRSDCAPNVRCRCHLGDRVLRTKLLLRAKEQAYRHSTLVP
jgi:hypothetical protein